ncbi:MAG: transglutaminase domain-containing protein, partial [Bacteroidota bacterium]
VGSIFEYKYRLVTTDLETLKPWHFQGDLPVLYSDVRLVGFDEQDYLVASIGTFTPRVKNQPLRWIRKNLPSLVLAPYGPGAGTERIALHFQFSHQPTLYNLASDFTSRQSVKSKAQQDSVRWRILNENLEYGSQFSESPERYAALQSIVQGLIRSDTSAKEVAHKLYHHLRDHLRWNGHYRAWVAQSPGDIYFRRQGSSAELNLLLLEMLRIAGLPAQKCFIATRDHGPDRWQLPFLSAFNHVVVRLPLGSENIMMDLTESVPWGLLPLNSLVKQGYIAWGVDSGWIKLPPRSVNRSSLSVKIAREEGGLRLDCQGSAVGYERLRWATILAGDSTLAMAPVSDVEMPFVWQALRPIPIQSLPSTRLSYLDSIGVSPPCLVAPKRDLPLDFLYPKEVRLELRLPNELAQPNGPGLEDISQFTPDSSLYYHSQWKQGSEEWIGTIKWGITETYFSSLH